jgi:uncharacterized BrkB/YihY/UPF0761 family membrane protein
VWAIGLGALLIALRVARRQPHAARSRMSEENRHPAAGPGRSADTLPEIPSKGLKDILLRVYRGISEDRILLVAAGVTFYILLSIFPGIATLISIYGLFADPVSIANHLEMIATVAPEGAVQVLHDETTRLATHGEATLGLGFLISFAFSLWTAKSGVTSIFDALNIVYGEKEKRGFMKYYLMSLAFTVGTIGFVLLSIAVVVLMPVVLNYIPLPGEPARSSKSPGGRSSSSSPHLPWQCSIDTAQTTPNRAGVGSVGEVPSPP